MSLAPADKIISIPTKTGRVLVQVGALTPADKVVSIQTATGPVIIPVPPLTPGDKVVAIPTKTGRVLVPTLATARGWTMIHVSPGNLCCIYRGVKAFMAGTQYKTTMDAWEFNNILNYGETCGLVAIPDPVHAQHNTHSLAAISADALLAGVSASGIWKSTNSGSTWAIKQYFGALQTYAEYTALASLGSGICLVFALWWPTENGIWRSTDSGETWTYIKEIVGDGITTVGCRTFADCGGGVVLMGTYGGGGLNDIWRSTDYGSTWSIAQSLASGGGVIYVAYIGGGVCLAGTLTGEIWRSTNSGSTWTKITELTDTTFISGIVHLGSGKIFAGGFKTGGHGRIWKSLDYGLTWALEFDTTSGGGIRGMAGADGRCIVATMTSDYTTGNIWQYA